MNYSQRSKIIGPEMRFLRKLEGKTRRDKIGFGVFREQMDIIYPARTIEMDEAPVKDRRGRINKESISGKRDTKEDIMEG